MDEQWTVVTKQLALLKEKFVYGEAIDPVFEGVVRDFAKFDSILNDIFDKVNVFLRSFESLCDGLTKLSDTLVKTMANQDDTLIASDCVRMKEATQQICRADAPHASLAKLRRDLDYNIVMPLKQHLSNNRNIRAMLDSRRNKLIEVTTCQKLLEDAQKKSGNTSKLKDDFENAKKQFMEIDKQVFEWLLILDEYKGDILDSALQTLKYLQYEFFASASHSIAKVLPPRMEFRPMVEMTPRHLESQIQLEMEEEKIVAEISDSFSQTKVGPIADYSSRMVERMERDRLAVDAKSNETVEFVDPLSLSSLLSHGFDEGQARKALKLNGNDTQAALEYLINPPPPSALAVVVSGGEEGSDSIVRMPATLARIQRLKEVKRKIQERKNEKEKREDISVPSDLLNLNSSDVQFSEQATSLPLIDWQ